MNTERCPNCKIKLQYGECHHCGLTLKWLEARSERLKRIRGSVVRVTMPDGTEVLAKEETFEDHIPMRAEPPKIPRRPADIRREKCKNIF